jgi:renierapurpurin 18,18'-hydroxylase
MELATTLQGQTVQNRVREVGINKNHWYPVAWANQLQPGQVIAVTVWQQPIALYRDTDGQPHALEDACPHKGVALHNGQVQKADLLCPYHGWQFDGSGNCVGIPYWPEGQKLPCAQTKSYAVQEKYGVIWLFPGDQALAGDRPPPHVPEFDDPRLLLVPITGRFQAHFSICNENTMDVFHGFLHNDLQGWFDPVLLRLKDGEDEVCADYQVSYRGWITKFLGLSDVSDQTTTRTVSIQYRYPHYHTSLEGVSSLYLMRLPVGPTETRSFSLLFLKLPLPIWLLRPIKAPLSWFILRFIFIKFLNQDVEMMESEQQTYLRDRQRRYVEINPAIIALQRLIIRQYEQFVQQSSQLTSQLHHSRSGDVQRSGTLSNSVRVSQVDSPLETFRESAPETLIG